MGVEQGPSKPDRTIYPSMPCPRGIPQYHSYGGDSAGDIQMAREAGAAGCIGICWRKQAAHLQADVAIAQLDEIQIGEI